MRSAWMINLNVQRCVKTPSTTTVHRGQQVNIVRVRITAPGPRNERHAPLSQLGFVYFQHLDTTTVIVLTTRIKLGTVGYTHYPASG